MAANLTFAAGHSLGGALVQVFAAALAKNHPEISSRVSGLYTFGMPRVGDVAFATAMERHYPDCAFRITHAADIIPLVGSPLLSIPMTHSQMSWRTRYP